MRLTRRELLLGAAALPLAADKKAPLRPNVIVAAVDGIGNWMLGASGNKDIRTPNLDFLANTSTRFSRAVSGAVAPDAGRTVILTGRPPRKATGTASLPDLLSSAGYASGSAPLNDLTFLDSQKPGQPFVLVLTQPPPGAIPEKYTSMYAGSRFENLGWDNQAPNAAKGKEAFQDIRASLRNAAAAVSMLDDLVGAVLAKLDQRALKDSTAVLFTSTHGELLGRHGLWNSAAGSDPVNLYEEVVTVPMIWHWTMKFPPQAVRPEVVSTYDIVPTICDLLGVRCPDGLPGRSFLPALLGQPFPKKQPWLNVAYSEFESAVMSRDKRYKLVLRNDGKGPNDLFDVVNDPRERINQYQNAQFVTIRDEMAGEIAAWRAKY